MGVGANNLLLSFTEDVVDSWGFFAWRTVILHPLSLYTNTLVEFDGVLDVEI